METKYKFLAIAMMAVLFASCNEDLVQYTIADQPDDMHITVSDTVLILNKGLEKEDAVTFNWSPAKSPIETYDSITYALRLYNTNDRSGNSTDWYSLGTATTKSFTTDELNTIIGKWVLAGESINLTAEVVGTVNNDVKYIKPEISTVTFEVTGYEKYPANLFLHMILADGSEQMTRLSQRTMGTGIYEATVNVQSCSYYFTTTATSNYPAYGSAGGKTISYVNSGDVARFSNEETGTRTFVVDTNNDYMDCNVYNIVQLPSGYANIVGNGCSIGWDLGNSGAAFSVDDARHPYLWSWTGEFYSGGEIKIALGTGWGDQFFFAPSSAADPLTEHALYGYRYQDNGGDLKWVPSVSGKYKFTLCLLADDLHTSFEPAD